MRRIQFRTYLAPQLSLQPTSSTLVVWGNVGWSLTARLSFPANMLLIASHQALHIPRITHTLTPTPVIGTLLLFTQSCYCL